MEDKRIGSRAFGWIWVTAWTNGDFIKWTFVRRYKVKGETEWRYTERFTIAMSSIPNLLQCAVWLSFFSSGWLARKLPQDADGPGERLKVAQFYKTAYGEEEDL